MEYLYILVINCLCSWEDIIIYDNKEDAINASIEYAKFYRVEIFKKIDNRFIPTYCFYDNGILIENVNKLI